MTLTLQYICHQPKLAMVLQGKTQKPSLNRCIMKGPCKVFKVAHTNMVETDTKNLIRDRR